MDPKNIRSIFAGHSTNLNKTSDYFDALKPMYPSALCFEMANMVSLCKAVTCFCLVLEARAAFQGTKSRLDSTSLLEKQLA